MSLGRMTKTGKASAGSDVQLAINCQGCHDNLQRCSNPGPEISERLRRNRWSNLNRMLY
jgi:hypothetical protein